MSSPFVGRAPELEEMCAALESARRGAGRILLLVGEPGIGKTRTAQELARHARARGFRVLAARGHEVGGAPAYWPWTQILRSELDARGARAVLDDLGAAAADVARVVPLPLDASIELPAWPALEPEQARFRAFDGVARFLRRLATREPLLVLLDDAHWADAASLMLLAFVAQDVAELPIAILCAYREEELRANVNLSRAVAELVRYPSRRIALQGLSPAEVARFMVATADVRPTPGVVDLVHRITDGNPLFLTEVARLLASDARAEPCSGPAHAGIAIPDTLRAVIRTRLDRLAPDSKRVLSVAAVVGREFDLALLARVSGRSGEELTAPVDDAVEARVLVEVREVPERYRFSHALIREVLHDELGVSERAQLHRRVGEALEAAHVSDREAQISELAYHYSHCAAGGGADKALDYLMRAGAVAARRLAHEEAAGCFERALQVARQAGAPDALRLELRLLASESLASAGDSARSRAGFWEAAQAAEHLGRTAALARAALGFAGPVAALGGMDRDAASILERALHALPATDSALRAGVLARLGMEIGLTGDQERSRALADEALAIARSVDDLEVVALAIGARRQAVRVGDDFRGRLGVVDELLDRATSQGDARIAMLARHWRLNDLLELGEVPAFAAELEAFADLAEDRRDPLSLYRASALRATLALLEGRFEDAERLAEEFLAIGRRVSPDNALHAYLGHVGLHRFLRGPFADVLTLSARMREAYPHVPVWRAAIAAAHAGLGRHAAARAEIEAIAANGFARLPENLFRVPACALLARATAELPERPHAAELCRLMAPHAGRNVVVGFGALAYGAVDSYLGAACAATGDFSRAERWFESGLALETRMGARPFAAQTRASYARMLLARGADGDRRRAAELAGAARREAEALGLQPLLATLAALDLGTAASAGGEPAAIASSREAPAHPHSFVREGEYWSIGEAGRAFRVRDAIGLRCLAVLLRNPGREVLALDLACAARDGGVPLELAAGAEVLLDGAARAAYRKRIEGLRAQVEEARAFNDLERASRAESEIELVAAELGRALGLGGRPRTARSPLERARQNVTRAIWKAVRRIASIDAAIGLHLESSVRTGTFCSYGPPPAAPILWRV